MRFFREQGEHLIVGFHRDKWGEPIHETGGLRAETGGNGRRDFDKDRMEFIYRDNAPLYFVNLQPSDTLRLRHAPLLRAHQQNTLHLLCL